MRDIFKFSLNKNQNAKRIKTEGIEITKKNIVWAKHIVYKSVPFPIFERDDKNMREFFLVFSQEYIDRWISKERKGRSKKRDEIKMRLCF